MSTTIHRHAPQHLGWYAVAAVLAGAVLALVILVLQSNGSTAPPSTIVNPAAHYPHFRTVGCLAGHPVPNPELPRCIKPVG